jgi:nitroreductase
MDTLTTLATRRSTRMFKPEQIKDTDLQTILQAGMAAPIGHSDFQGVQIVALQNKEALAELDKYCTEQIKNPNYHMFYNAPTLIFVCAKPKEDGSLVYIADVACVMENMHLAATELGLGSVYLWAMVNRIPESPSLKEILGIPEEFKPLSVLAVGYPKQALPQRTFKDLKPNRIATKVVK